MSSKSQQRSVAADLMMMHPLALVGCGGALGSLIRHGATSSSHGSTTVILALNVLGSLLLGSLTSWLHHGSSALHGPAGQAREHWAALLGLGFCGGLTTFSTHMVEVARHFSASTPTTGLGSLATTACLAIAAAALGYAVMKRSVSSKAGTTR